MKSASASRPSAGKAKAKAPPVPSREMWVCESCGHVSEGVDPPDECSWCTHTYFQNMHDIEEEMGQDELGC